MCLLFDELFGSENISQVYAIILEFFATLEKREREKLKYLLYGKINLRNICNLTHHISVDDMCHLAPYAVNMVGRHDTELTRYFSEMNKAVDFLHFKVGIFYFL